MKRRIALDLIADEVFRRLLRDCSSVPEHPLDYVLRTAAEVESEWEERTRRPGIEERAPAAVATELVLGLDQVQAAVDALPPRQRQVLGLHLQGLRYQQIAVQLALEDDVVLQELASAYSHLRWELTR